MNKLTRMPLLFSLFKRQIKRQLGCVVPVVLVIASGIALAQSSLPINQNTHTGSVTQVDPLPGKADDKSASPSIKPALRNKSAVQPGQISVQLGAPSAAEKLTVRKNGLQEKRQQLGFGRTLPTAYQTPIDLSKLAWSALPGGAQSAVLTIASPEAVALRAAVSVGAAAPGIELRFFNPATPDIVFGPYLAAEEIRNKQQIHPTLASSFSHAIFWSPLIEGNTIGIEIYLPAGVDLAQLELTVPMVSHFFLSAAQAQTRNQSALPQVDTRDIGSSYTCEVDEVCYASTWGTTAASIAKLLFTEGASSYLCSGTLLNNNNQDRTPYMLTANHCISDSATASTLITTWLFQSSSCNSGSMSPLAVDRTGGAKLLATGTDTDFTFLQLNDTPPSGATFAGWSINPLNVGQAVTGIHHPEGDLKKITFSKFVNYQSWNGLTGPSSHIYIESTLGYTEGGSSGSGLFITDGSGVQRLVGQLHGGYAASCGDTAKDLYGRFDSTYASISSWLAPTGMAAKVDVRTYVPAAAAGGGYISYLRVINTGSVATPVNVAVVNGTTGLPGFSAQLISSLPAGAAMTFSAAQVEAAMGISLAAADRPRIRVSALTAATIETQSFLLQPGGAFNEVSGAQSAAAVEVRTYVPAAAAPSGYVSYLRVINTGISATPVAVARIDPVTGVQGTVATLNASLPAGAAITYTAAQVEAALGISIAAAERPRILVSASNSTLDVQSFLIQPGGAFTEVSSGQAGSSVEMRSYLPAAASGYTTYLRVINAGTVTTPISATLLDPVTGLAGASGIIIASLAPSAATTLTSSQVEAALGVTVPANSRPRMRISTATSDLRVQSFLLQPGGAFNEISNAISGTSVTVRTYIPAAEKGTGYTSYLRVINTGTSATTVSIALIDGPTGTAGTAHTLLASLPAGAAQTLSSDQIEASLGLSIAAGSRPRMQVSATSSLEVQSFLTQPGGAFTEVSGGL